MATFLRLTNELIDVAAASSSSETGERRVRDATEALLPLLAPGNEADGALSVVTTFVQLLQEGGAALLESVRRLGGHCACLPSHQSSWEEMEAMISATANAVEALCQGNNILDFSSSWVFSSVSCYSRSALTHTCTPHSARHTALHHFDSSFCSGRLYASEHCGCAAGV